MELVVEADRRQPLVTGTSVIGIKYEGGVMLAADNLGAFPDQRSAAPCRVHNALLSAAIHTANKST